MELKNSKFQIYNAKKPKAVVLFLHGALEYSARYNEFFSFLNEQNYIVITVDHPGHGQNHVGNYHLEKISDLEKNAMDLKLFAEENYPNLEHHIIAHSMGTIVARNLLIHRNLKFGKVILSGTFNPNQNKLKMGKATINVITKVTGPKQISKIANFLMFGEFKLQMYVKYRTTNWINSSDILYKEYQGNKACNQAMDNLYIKAILEQVKRATSPSAIATLKSHEYLILSGVQDPVNNFGRELNRFSKRSRIDYSNMRHEILLEPNKHLVYNDIINFLEK